MTGIRAFLLAAALAVVPAAASLAQGSAPITQPDSATLDEDTVVVVYPLLNDSDPQGGSLELIDVSNSSVGDSRIDGQAVVFTPNENYNGPVDLTYSVSSEGGESTGEINLMVNPVNDAPVANADSADAVSGTARNIDVIANDFDVEEEALTLMSVANPGNGTAATSGPFVVYTGNDGFAGVDFVTYVVADASGATSQGTLTLNVSLPAATTTTTTTTTTTAPTTTVVAPITVPVTTPAPPVTTTLPPATTAPGSTLVAGPQWAPPTELLLEAGDGNSEGFYAMFSRNLNDLYLPLLTLLVVGIAAWLLSQRGRSPLRKHAVVLLGRLETLAVFDKPNRAAKVVHRYDYSARQIEVIGRRREADETVWLPVATPDGQGWVEAGHLTEDVARASFESDIAERDLVRELRRRLKAGATIATSPRGMIDPEAFERDSQRRQLGSHATGKLTALIGDWRASFHIDKTASMAALRPPQLRNLHWVSFEAPGHEPWQLFFEYHDGQPYPVAALPETAPVEV